VSISVGLALRFWSKHEHPFYGSEFSKALSTLATIVADFGDYSRQKQRQSPNSATVVASVDRA